MACKLVYDKHGEPVDVLRIENVPAPTKVTDSKNVLVKMKYSSINPADINMVQGIYPGGPKMPGAVGGSEGVGTVIDVGADVKGLSKGDIVMCVFMATYGTWQSHVEKPEADFKKVDPKLDLVIAATLKSGSATGYRIVKDFTTLKKGDVLVQNGANSAVGQAIIQFCKALGVITVNIIRDRPNIDDLKDFLKNLGADFVWTEQQLKETKAFSGESGEDALPKASLAVDCVGGDSGSALIHTLKPGASMVVYGAMSFKPVTIGARELIFTDNSVKGFWMSRWYREHSLSDALQMVDEISRLSIEHKFSSPQVNKIKPQDWKQGMGGTFKGQKGGKFLLDFS